MALHGGDHLELKKMRRGYFWGLFGIRLGRCPGIIPEKISFLQFYSRFLCFSLMLLHYLSSNTNRSANARLMLSQRRRRWANSHPALTQRFVLNGEPSCRWGSVLSLKPTGLEFRNLCLDVWTVRSVVPFISPSSICYPDTVSPVSAASFDVDPTLHKCYANIFCLLGSSFIHSMGTKTDRLTIKSIKNIIYLGLWSS